ncbi:MAG: hypothetical protein ABIP29_01855 [Candidatus Eisenbacteria bacterium]
MSPRSSDPRCRTLHLAPLVALLVFLAGTAPAAQAKPGRITVTRDGARPDSVQVKEITIDDEGIRVIGANRELRIPGDSGDEVDVKIDADGVRVLQGLDSLDRIIVHGHGGNEIVQFFKDVTIEKGETTGDVVSLFGNVKNFGTVGGDCVAILGSIEQGDSAAILGDAVTIGGALRELGQGARVEGQTVAIGFLPFAGVAFPSVPLLIFFALFAYVLFVALAALFARLFPERLVRIADTVSRRTFLSLVLGLLSGPLVLMAGLLLLVTVIGIPLALLLPLLYPLAAFIGYAAAAYLLGLKLLGRRPDAGGPMLVPIAAGTGFITLFLLLGLPLIALEGGFRVLGFALIALWIVVGMVCWMIGFGALLLSRFGQDPGRRESGQWYPAGSPGTGMQPPPPSSSIAPGSMPASPPPMP